MTSAGAGGGAGRYSSMLDPRQGGAAAAVLADLPLDDLTALQVHLTACLCGHGGMWLLDCLLLDLGSAESGRTMLQAHTSTLNWLQHCRLLSFSNAAADAAVFIQTLLCCCCACETDVLSAPYKMPGNSC